MVDRVKDGFGNEYGVGAHIVYAINEGSSAALVKATVLEIRDTDAKGVPLRWYNGKPTVRLKVQPTSFGGYGGHWRTQRCHFDDVAGKYVYEEVPPKPVILTTLTNVLLIDHGAHV